MATEVKCPECGSITRVPAGYRGSEITCGYCEKAVPLSPSAAGPQEEELLEPEPVGPDGADNRKPCPMCGELIPPQALKCRFCGEIFDPELKKAQQPEAGPDDDLSTADWIFGLLCGGIACIVGIIWLIQGKKKGAKLIGVAFISQLFWGLIRALAEAGKN